MNEQRFRQPTPMIEANKDVDPKRETRTAVRRYLDKHIRTISTGWQGNKEAKGAVSGAMVGAIDGRIDRCDPPLQLPKLNIEGGTRYVLWGPNGAGKSTLLDAMMQRDGAEFGTRTDDGGAGYGKGMHGSESVRIVRLDQEELFGPALQGETVRTVIEEIQTYFDEQFPDLYLTLDGSQSPAEMDQIMQAAEQNVAAIRRFETLREKMKDLFDIGDIEDRKVSELSGGERTKLALLTVLASEPDVLLLDEPTNHLDLENIAKLLGLFDVYERDGVAVVNVSHSDWYLKEAGKSGHTYIIDQKKGERTVRRTASTYEQAMKDANVEKEGSFIRSVTWATTADQTDIAPLITGGTMETVPDSPLTDIEVPSIRGQAMYVISGKNGAGKTKLIEAMAAGTVGRKEKGTTIAYLPQFWPEHVAKGNIETFFGWIKDTIDPNNPDKNWNQFVRALGAAGVKFDTGKLRTQPLARFSGGEQRLLWFTAASIFPHIDALILDEPTNHIDRKGSQILTEAIQSFPGTVLLSSHDIELLERLEESAGDNKIGIDHIIVEKDDGVSMVYPTDESPITYAKTLLQSGKKKGSRTLN